MSNVSLAINMNLVTDEGVKIRKRMTFSDQIDDADPDYGDAAYHSVFEITDSMSTIPNIPSTVLTDYVIFAIKNLSDTSYIYISLDGVNNDFKIGPGHIVAIAVVIDLSTVELGSTEASALVEMFIFGYGVV